ncbi:MAG: protein kinase [Acidobacteriaceae bacterium]|nr:protein kinase [Acidobacteriaceae bacterium]MBV9294794.1 protein kinase [Acidobacteriaceae bacterium]
MRCNHPETELTRGTVGGLCPLCLIDMALPERTPQDNGPFRYDLIEEIGRGGMGVVYRALQHGSQRQVAVKMVLAEQTATPEILERFRAEGEAIAALDHPHILPIYEMGEMDGAPFFSMRLATGGTLREHVSEFHRQPRAAAQLVAKIARALHHAHEHGILHRDLKPGNVLLDGVTREPFVCDFGLAKWLDRASHLTVATSALGTPHYMSPEQATGDSNQLTPAADVYSLGVILYELLTGRLPFAGDTLLETLRLAESTPPPAPRSFEVSIPRDLELICLKCLAKEPAGRYRSAAMLAEDLERWLKGHPVLARPAGPIERGWRWTKRNPLVAALSGALLIVPLSLFIALLGFQRAQPSHFTEAVRKQNFEAQSLYLQGVFFSNKSTEEGLRQGLDFFQRSLEKDPTSARSWAGIARAWNWLADAYVSPAEAYPHVKFAAEKALALDAENAEAHLWMGQAKRVLDWDFKGFRNELDRAQRLDPNSATVHIFLALDEIAQGNTELAVAHLKEAIRLDPLSPSVSHCAAIEYMYVGHLDEAIDESRRTLKLDPNYIYRTPTLADIYREKGMFPEAIALFLRAQEITGAPQPGLAITYARLGRTAEAREILEDLKQASRQKVSVEDIASVYVALGEKDEAFKWLNRALDDHGGGVEAIPLEPVFRALHPDWRFREVVRHIGLDPLKVLRQ